MAAKFDFNDLAVFRLKAGAHKNAEDGVCAMEAVAWLAGLEHSDAPSCTCPAIAGYVRRLNDRMGDTVRQQLVAYLPRLVGTVSPQHEQARCEYLAWQAVTVFAPIALRARGRNAEADRLASARESTGGDLRKAAALCRAYAAAAYAAAAYAAADAAAAAAAAAYAAYAAAAAAAAAYAAACAKDWRPALAALDGVLAIGRASQGFSPETTERVSAYRELIGAVAG